MINMNYYIYLLICILLIINNINCEENNKLDIDKIEVNKDNNNIVQNDYLENKELNEINNKNKEIKRILPEEIVWPTACNRSLYQEWADIIYDGFLASDSSFWRYQNTDNFRLTNGLALELAAKKCKDKFEVLYQFKAGRSGPIDVQNCYKAMCKNECTESDKIHMSVMQYTGCKCMDLSTKPEEMSYHISGDWCRHNSARMLCDIVGYCGIWECELNDFMCPRLEWNKKWIDYKGYGHCDRSAASSSYQSSLVLSGILTITLLLMSSFL